VGERAGGGVGLRESARAEERAREKERE